MFWALIEAFNSLQTKFEDLTLNLLPMLTFSAVKSCQSLIAPAHFVFIHTTLTRIHTYKILACNIIAHSSYDDVKNSSASSLISSSSLTLSLINAHDKRECAWTENTLYISSLGVKSTESFSREIILSLVSFSARWWLPRTWASSSLVTRKKKPASKCSIYLQLIVWILAF